MFKVDEIKEEDEKDDDEDANPLVKAHDNLLVQTVVKGNVNGNNFVQLRIPKRYQNNIEEYKELANEKKGNLDWKDEILQRESEIFLKWRRNLNQIETEMMQEYKENIATKKDFLKYKMNKITPYEKNLDIWRQLWITVESCELLCIIIDSRNPLFFRNIDLED